MGSSTARSMVIVLAVVLVLTIGVGTWARVRNVTTRASTTTTLPVAVLPPATAAPVTAAPVTAAPPVATAAPVTAPTTPPTEPPPPVIAAAGDIACPAGRSPSADECAQAATSDLLVVGDHDAVLALGDLQYDAGSAEDFATSYGPSWGRVRDRTRPVVGNHEYGTPGASGYFGYFGAAAGDPTEGWYSWDLGAWHLVALNSNCSIVSCAAGSPQEQWLRADLAAHPTTCTLVYWHHPRWSSGLHGTSDATGALVQAAYDLGADLLLVGHDHHYERFAPQDPAGNLDPARGIRQFVVGTGGRSHYATDRPQPNSEVRDSTTFGVLELTLQDAGYDWRFVPVAGGTFTDQGSQACH